MSQNPTQSVETVLSMLQGMDDAYAAANANTGDGMGGEWPPAGKHACYVLDCFVKAAPNRKFGKTSAGADVTCSGVTVQFQYQCIDAIPGRALDLGALVWLGDPIFIAQPGAVVPETHKWIKEMGAARLKGAVQTILGRTGTDPKVDIAELVSRIKSTKIAVNVVADYNDREKGGKTRTYRTDYINELLAR